jgi:hypothetical protein
VDDLATSRALKSPSRKPWSFSEVESLPQNNLPWGEPSAEVEAPMEMETPVDLGNPELPLVSALAASNRRSPGSSVMVTSVDKSERQSLTVGFSGSYASNDDLSSPGAYQCLRCKQHKVGVRFVMVREHRGAPVFFSHANTGSAVTDEEHCRPGKSLCPSCEAILLQRHENSTLPGYLRLLLKYALPPIATVQTSAAPGAVGLAGTGEERVADKERIEGLVAALESQVRALEHRLSQIISTQDKHQA